MLFVVFLSRFLIVSLASAFEGQEEIKVKPGEDATLQCQGPREADITLLEWIRPELKSDGYVFFYRNGRSYEKYQHPSFHGRVELRDKSSVKDGDVSVILKNVSIADTGTYECRIIISSTERSEKTSTELKNLINLKVTDSGYKAENTWNGTSMNNNGGNKGALSIGVTVGWSVAAVVLAVNIGFLDIL